MTARTSELPRRRPGLELSYTADGPIIRREPPEVAFRLNSTAVALWELCDGTTSPEEMVVALSTLFDASVAEIRDSVRRGLVDLATAGLVDWEGTG